MAKDDTTIEVRDANGKTLAGPVSLDKVRRKLREVPLDRHSGESRNPGSDNGWNQSRSNASRKRKLILGGDPDQLYQGVPVEADFDEEGEEYIEAEDVARIGRAIQKDVLSELKDVSVLYLWKRKGGWRNGKAILGKAHVPKGITAFFCTYRALVILSADHVKFFKLDCYQLEALVFHELQHLEATEGLVRTRGHDFEAFKSEVERYGTWKPDLDLAAQAFKQLELI